MSVLRDDNIEHLGIKIMLSTGLRVGELAALRWEDITEGKAADEKFINIFIAHSMSRWKEDGVVHITLEDAKGHKTRPVLLPYETKGMIFEKIRELNPTGEYLMMKGDYHITAKAIADAQSRACKKAGIPHYSTHKNRKTYISYLMEYSNSGSTVISQVGHSDFETTLRHYYFPSATTEEKAEILKGFLSQLFPLYPENEGNHE